MKPMNLSMWSLLVSILFSTLAIGQNTKTLESSSFIKFKSAEKFPVSSSNTLLLSQIKTTPENYSFKKGTTKMDPLGFTHISFQQHYLGIPVEFSEQKVHLKEGYINSISGKVHSFEDLDTEPAISAAQGLEIAMAHINAKQYLWEEDAHNHLLESCEKPEGELMIFPVLRTVTTLPKLVYRYYIQATAPLYAGDIYVDANDGSIVFEHSKIVHADVAASGQSLYNGNVTFTAEELVPGNFRLKQSTTGGGVWTSDSQGSPYGSVEIQSTSTTFNHPIGVQAHWAAEQTYQYFAQTHNRNSYDGNNAQMRVFVGDQQINNAVWLGNKASFGNGDGITYNPFVTCDIVGHEFTHGVVQTSANLIYQNESGALNESFADIFGECVEHFATGNHDWKIGADITITASAIRSFSNPNSLGHPDTYQGQYWATGPFDYGGVHTNSGVQNHWFYLLSEGGSGTNDFGKSYTVQAIGMNKAAAIAYRSLTVYLTNSSNYFDARDAAIQAAEDLYGIGTMEVDAVKDAWYAVGIGQAANDNSTVVCANGSLTVELDFDQNPRQTAFYIKNTANNYVYLQPLGSFINTPPNSSTSISIPNLAPGNYLFGMGDWGPDGLCCSNGNGSYTLTDGTTDFATGGDFDFIETTQFCVSQEVGRDFDVVKPSSPTIISAQATQTSIDLSWTAATDDQGPVGYIVFYGEEQLVANLVNTSTTITGLTPNTSYTLTVFASDLEGNTSDKSNEVIINTLPISSCATGNLSLEIQLDGKPEETLWDIKDASNNIVASSNPAGYANATPNTLVTETIPALPDGDYLLVIYDRGGDGLCCTNGLGSYDLKDASQNIIVDGGQFGFSAVTEFCVGMSNGGGLDTEAPTAPINLTAFNPTSNSVDINFTPSTDNDAVLYYGLFANGVYIGAFTPYDALPITVNVLAPATTYDFQLVARDFAGNFSGFSNTATATTLPAEVLIHEGYFETSMDGWTDGGADCRRVKNADRSYEGIKSVRLRDNSGIASSMTLSNIDLSSYDEIRIEFEYYIYSFEGNEDFFVQYFDGTNWTTVRTFTKGIDFNGDGFNSATIVFNREQYGFASNSGFRIQCDASGNGDHVYIDQVIIHGVPSSGTSSSLIQPEIADISKLFEIQAKKQEVVDQITPNNLQLENSMNTKAVGVEIYPNPTSKQFMISPSTELEIIQVRLLNASGMLIRSFKGWKSEYNVSDLTPGVYWVQIIPNEGKTVSQKIIIQ